MIHEKTKEYMERAEKLKKHITDNDASEKKKPAAVGANGKVSGGKKYVDITLLRLQRPDGLLCRQGR